jgi:thioredoxin-related protein
VITLLTVEYHVMRFPTVCFALLIVAGWASMAVAQKSAPLTSPYVSVTKFDPSRDASRDIADAVKEAGVTGKHVLLDVGGDWCSWCKRLDTLFVRNDSLRSFLESRYVAVKINYSKENRNEAVLSRYPAIKGYPHLFVLDTDGTLLHSQDSAELERGKGHDPGLVMAFLKKWAP